MPFVSNFSLTTTSPPTNPYIYNFDKTNQVSSILNNCNGSITNVGITGGTPPYTITWIGPDSFTGNSLNLTNLCAGVYTATTRDINSLTNTEYIEILNLSAGTFSASTIDGSCLSNINEYCKIRVHSFNHEQTNFTYNLYRDGNLHETYKGTTGNEIYDFVNLEPGNYTLTAYDGISVDYNSTVPSNPCCLDGYSLNSENYGQVINTYTGLSAVNILDEFYKMNLNNDFTIAFGNGYGPNAFFPTTDTIFFETGLKPDGSIETDNPYVWLFTGATADRKTDNNIDWYLGALYYPMLDGQQSGPPGLTAVGDIGKFYFNTAINKFVIRVQGISVTPDSWSTVHAFGDRGNTYSPIANDLLTGFTYYKTNNATVINEVGYTVTGTTNDCCEWVDLTSTSNSLFVLDGNTNYMSYTYSECSYLNYTHQFSIGSYNTDDDTIGVILAKFVDTLGEYGPVNSPQILTLQFNNVNDENSVAVYNNGGRNSAFAWVDPNRKVVNCGEDTIVGCSSTDITGYTATVLTRPRANSPFANGNYANQGTTFIKIERKGPLGEQFRIQMTDLAKSTVVGTQLPFNPDYEINFNLLDKNTWEGESLSAKDVYYVPEDGLYKYLGSQQIGYIQQSQRQTSMYNIGFTGTQSNFISTMTNFGGSQTQLFPLYNSALQGVQMSLNTELEFYSSIGGGAEVGKPTVPKVQPKASVLMQTTQIPIASFTGGTKISADTSTYKIYTDKDYIAQPEGVDEELIDPCIELTFRWDKNSTNLIDGNMIPYYSIHPYSPENKRFLPQATNLRIFDNSKNVKYIMDNSNQVIGEGLQVTDCVNFKGTLTNSEFLVKPNYIFKNKLDNLKTNSCGAIPPVSGYTSGYTESERWYDTFENNPDLILKGGFDSTGSFSWDEDGIQTARQYGLYDAETDFYFITTPKVEELNLDTSDIEYGKPNECGRLLTEQHVVMSAYTSGSTTMPLLVSGSPYNVVLNFPAGGTPQVTLNGLTLFASQDEDFDDNGDYYFNGTQVITFQSDTLQPEDLINVIYVPGTFEKSYYFDNYIVPSVVPNLSADTSVSGNTLYTDGYYYYFKMTYDPIGDIGLVLNGSILTQDSDFKLISSDTVQFTGIVYPTGLQENDVISQFYFTKLTLQGTSGVKNPNVVVGLTSQYGYTDELMLLVRDSEGTIVYTETQICDLEQFGSLRKVFTITVPEPGDYSYSVIRTVKYTLINGDEVSNSDTSPSYKFKIPASIFYGVT